MSLKMLKYNKKYSNQTLLLHKLPLFHAKLRATARGSKLFFSYRYNDSFVSFKNKEGIGLHEKFSPHLTQSEKN